MEQNTGMGDVCRRQVSGGRGSRAREPPAPGRGGLGRWGRACIQAKLQYHLLLSVTGEGVSRQLMRTAEDGNWNAVTIPK